MEANRERFMRILSKFEKKVIVKDPLGEDFELILRYPSIRNSEEFWDVIYETMNLRGKSQDELTPEDQMFLMKNVLPKIVLFVIKCYETNTNEPLSEMEKDLYSALVYSNIGIVTSAFLEMAEKMLGGSDAPKNPKAAALQTE